MSNTPSSSLIRLTSDSSASFGLLSSPTRKSTLTPDGETNAPEEGLAIGAPRLRLSGLENRRELCNLTRAADSTARMRLRSKTRSRPHIALSYRLGCFYSRCLSLTVAD